ncbi:MAG: alkaline shock response membrane anchor protein AmaP [Dehalococcoidia bacterium]
MDRMIRVPVFLINLAIALFLGVLALALWLQGRATRFAGLDVPAITMPDETRLAVGVTAAVLAGLSLVLALAVVLPRRRSSMIALNSAQGGAVMIPAANVEQSVAEDVRSLSSVTAATAHAAQEKNGIAIDLSVVLRHEAELPAAVEQITSRVESALSTRYGTTIARKPRIEVRYAAATREEQRGEVKSPVTG